MCSGQIPGLAPSYSGGLLAHRTGDTGGMADIGWPICPTSQLLSTSGGDTIPGDPRTYKIVYVGWWQERDMLAHNYVVVEAETRATTPPERIFVRVERDKAGWWRLRGRNLLNEIMTARSEHVLTVNSFRVIFFTLDVDFTHRHEYNLQLLGRLLQIMDEAAPTYILPTVNCWWYSQCSFERLAHRIGADHITAYCQTSLYGFPTPPM
ncbi:hypothetical protein FRB97_007825 [Tulasnella sp. 331]|nr:hypothetical protein FRB97_007825 [Tulasnella sp. 331]